MTTKRSYIDSHWLVFAIQGVISILFGWYIMFTEDKNIDTLVAVLATTLLALGIIEMFNVIYRNRMQHTWYLNLAIALIEIAVALTLLFTMSLGPAFQLVVIAAYTICRGLFEILIGLKSIDDSTDKFIWLVCGICGVIIGFVVLNSGHFAETAFLQFFGTYMMIFGLGCVIYGVHNRSQVQEYHLARSAAGKKAAATRSARKKSLSAKSTTKSSVRTTTKKSARPAKSSKRSRSTKKK
ncbi:DUF308 domain-containing protein [Candidatus Saccharibacteria bacterium]|nr:DUF308 domain-containing protein [Candidatus Saccharibacteria bacterium]